MKKRPSFRIYAITKKDVNLLKTTLHLKQKFKATRLSLLEGDDINSVIFNVSMGKLNPAWTYLKKKCGIKKIWLGK